MILKFLCVVEGEDYVYDDVDVELVVDVDFEVWCV